MLTALLLLLGVSAPLGLVLLARWLDARVWRRNLVAFRFSIPGTVTTAEVARWLARLHACTASPAWYLVSNQPVALEISAVAGAITHTVLVPARLRQPVLASLHAALPSVRVTEVPDYFKTRPHCRVAAEATLSHQFRPLAVERAAETSQHLLASLQPLQGQERIHIQWVLSGTARRQPRRLAQGDTSPWWLDSDALAAAEDIRAERLKYRSPLLMASLRVGVEADDKSRAWRLLHRVWPVLGGMDGPGVQLVKRWFVGSGQAAANLAALRLPITRYPLLLNVDEAAGLMGLAAEGLHLPGLPAGIARTLPASSIVPRRGLQIAESNYPGDNRPLALLRSDRLRHVWALGPTGSGKSTLLQNMIYQDMRAGDGLLVIDARGDLVYDLLDRVPPERLNDVIVLDPSNMQRGVVGFNPLGLGHTPRERELAAEHVLSVLHSVYHANWGPRTADVMRAGLLTLVHATGADGSRLTLLELPEILTNDHFRQVLMQQPMSPALRAFWAWYENLSVAERSAVISPVLNKLRSFQLSTPLRLTLGQSDGIDLSDIFTKRRIVFVPLKKGVIGAESSALLGSLVMASAWQATLTRANIPPERRRPAWLYADEFQEVTRLPIDLADMLAQSRGLGLGLVLAHQHLGQLTPELKSAVLGTTRSQLVYQIEHEDARVLAPRFAPLTATDLQGLGTHEIAARLSVRGTTLTPVTGLTYPPAAALGSRDEVLTRSLTAYARPVADIEAGMAARTAATSSRRSHRRAKGGPA